MTAVEGLPTPRPSRDSGEGPRRDAIPSVDGLRRICPYLATADGAWRSANAVRDHRCNAVAPPVPLAIDKQRRLCLVSAHEDCPTYLAAVAARTDSRPQRTGPTRPIARMTPLILDQARFDLRLPAFRADRTSGQALLVGVLAVAFGAILLARPAGGAGSLESVSPGSIATGAAPSADPRSTGAAGGPSSDAGTPTPTPDPTPEPTTATDAPTEAPVTTASPAPSPAPSTSGETYRVKSGDTLVAIAARYGTTSQILIELNGIEDPSKLRIGQILKLP